MPNLINLVFQRRLVLQACILVLCSCFCVACDTAQKPLQNKVITLNFTACEGSDHRFITSRCGRFYPDTLQPEVYISFAILQLQRLNSSSDGTSSSLDVRINSNAPVLYLSGGPGDGGNTLAAKLDSWRYWLLDADIYHPFIVWDSRGNKGSWGYFECEAYRLWAVNQLKYPDLTDNNELERVEKCMDQWQGSIGNSGFMQFSSLQSADDAIALLTALGFEQWHLAATSYGARIAQMMAQKRPQNTLSMILDSPYSWADNSAAHRAVSWKDSFLAQLNYCQQHIHCHRGKEVETLFWQVIEKIDRTPLRVGFTVDGYRTQASLNAETFAHILFSGFYQPETLALSRADANAQPNTLQPLSALVPIFVELLAGKDSSRFQEIAQQVLNQSYSQGANPWLYWVTECNDNQVLDEPTYLAQVLQLGDWARFFNPDVSFFICQLPGLNQSSDWDAMHTVKLEVPAIILVGALDPVVTTAGVSAIRNTFPHSLEVNAVARGHGLLSAGICGVEWYSEFWLNPHAYIKKFLAQRSTVFSMANTQPEQEQCVLIWD